MPIEKTDAHHHPWSLASPNYPMLRAPDAERFLGIRAMVNRDAKPKLCASAEPHRLRDPAWRRGYAMLGAQGLIAEVMALPAQLADLAELAALHPGTQLVIGDTGMPLRRTAEEHALWQSGMAALVALPHVTVKISGLGMVDHHWTAQSIAPLVTETIAQFGPRRCMFASNFPVDGLHARYDAVWAAFDAITSDLAEPARALLFRETANRLYRQHQRLFV